MRNFIVILIQLIIWSMYSLLEWLSKHDDILYNILLFFVFIFISTQIGNKITKSTKVTILLTLVSLCIYGCLQFVLDGLFHMKI